MTTKGSPMEDTATRPRTRPYVVLERRPLIDVVLEALGETLPSGSAAALEEAGDVLVNVATEVAQNGDQATQRVADGPAFADRDGDVDLIPVSERWFIEHPYSLGMRRDVRRRDAA